MPTSTRYLGSFTTVGSAVYYSGGTSPPAYLEVFYGGPVAATTAPTPSPTAAPTTLAPTRSEGWATKTPIPSAIASQGQGCAADAAGMNFYLYGAYWQKYSAATDGWTTGACSRCAARLCRVPFQCA